MVLEHNDYRRYLKAVLAERISKNGSYSLRAMAKQLGVVSSQLSEVMNGKANFSLATALKVSQALSLPELESEYFCWLVQLETESSPVVKEPILQKLNRIRGAKKTDVPNTLECYAANE